MSIEGLMNSVNVRLLLYCTSELVVRIRTIPENNKIVVNLNTV